MSGKTRRQQIEAMLADTPNDPELHYFLGMEHLSENDAEAAVRCFRECHRTDAGYVPAYLLAAQSLVRLGRPTEAVQELRDGITAARKQNNLHALGEMEALLATLE